MVVRNKEKAGKPGQFLQAAEHLLEFFNSPPSGMFPVSTWFVLRHDSFKISERASAHSDEFKNMLERMSRTCWGGFLKFFFDFISIGEGIIEFDNFEVISSAP